MVGLGRLELPTSRLSSARSNQLSYKPRTFAQGLPGKAASRKEANLPFASEPAKASLSLEERETKAAKSRKMVPHPAPTRERGRQHHALRRDAMGTLFQAIQ